MEVKSEPKYELVQFTDIRVSYPGEVRVLELEDGKDTYVDDDRCDYIGVDLAGQEYVRFYRKHMHYVSITKRTLRRLVRESK